MNPLIGPISLAGCSQPASKTFTRQFITLDPLDVARDVEELFTISHASHETRQLWRSMSRGPFADVHEQAAFNDEKPLGPLKIQGDHGPVAFRNLTLRKL